MKRTGKIHRKTVKKQVNYGEAKPSHSVKWRPCVSPSGCRCKSKLTKLTSCKFTSQGTDTERRGMYSEWASLGPQVQSVGEERLSVLDTFPQAAGKEVVVAVVKQLSANLGIKQSKDPSPLTTDREVQWTMEVICYGLSLAISEHDTVRDCVSVYCEWLSALNPPAKVSVPQPVCEDPNLYARKIIRHFHNLFVPRAGEAADTMSRQAVLCHRVLRTLEEVAQTSTIMTADTWEALLLFLIAINDTLLAPPTVKDDVGDLLCERVLSVLVEMWVMACVRCFPGPPLWKTLREMCLNWRHRIALIEQWNRVHLALTARLLHFTYGPDFPQLKINEEDVQLIPTEMEHECVAQAWYRFLHCIGNPVDLSRPTLISQTPKFLQYAIASETVVDPCQHPCLAVLPQVFLKAIRGIAAQVDAFLGIACAHAYEDVTGERKDKESVGSAPPLPTPPPQRRIAKSFSVAPSAVAKGLQKSSLIGLTSSRLSTVQPPPTIPNSGPPSTSSVGSMSSMPNEPRPPLAPSRPKSNSILHLFGGWLFEAANIGYDTSPRAPGQSIKVDGRKTSQPNSVSDESEIPESIGYGKYEAGRAEALGALCRLFSAKKTGEDILPVYLARFYVSVYNGLQLTDGRECMDVMTAILLNSPDLFRVDLDGVLTLVPSFVSALEVVLPDREQRHRPDLRQACIQILLSLIALPLHYQNLPIKPLFPSISDDYPPLTVGQLRPRLINLLVDSLQAESDSVNTQMLLGGLLLAVEDAAAAEEGDPVTQPGSSHLLSSGSDTASARSFPSSDRRSLASDSGDFATDAAYDTAHGLYKNTIILVCCRLISSWTSDLNVSLAALEVLLGLARIQIKEPATSITEVIECKRGVKWVCDYIVGQCKKPPQAHSKDLHSSIVAAFHCCAVWLVEHPAILDDRDFLITVLEVVELGISGSISQGKPGEATKLKDEKELKPASMRVRDAAETLLNVIMEQVGYFPSPCGAESLSSLLDEISLLKHCNSWPGGDMDRVTATQRFKYFVVDNTILLALLEEPLGNDQDPQPTVTVIIRGPFGRHVWTMQLRHLPRSKAGSKTQHCSSLGRPVPLADAPVSRDQPTQHFPDSVNLIAPCRADRSIPSMDSLVSDDKENMRMRALIEQQAELEEAMRRVGLASEASLPYPDPSRECTPPSPCHELQTARLFLSHFGLLGLDSAKSESNAGVVMLDTNVSGFCTELEALDQLSPRTCDTVHIFYVRAGQKSAPEILGNVMGEGMTDGAFSELLLSLGWVVNVWQHPGWTGHISTSNRVQAIPEGGCETAGTPSLYNGSQYVLYWADVSSEIAFIVPTIKSVSAVAEVPLDSASSQLSSQGWYGRSVSVGSSHREAHLKARAMSLDLDKAGVEPTRPGRKAGSTRTQPFTDPPTKILLVWLESFEDSSAFPVGDLLGYCNTGLECGMSRPEDTFIMFLHPLNSGLLRVKLSGPTGRTPLPVSLVEGMLLPKLAFGPLVRQTALNISRRRRLHNDNYQPPHVRRRLKVQELCSRYQGNLSQPQLLTYLFAHS